MKPSTPPTFPVNGIRPEAVVVSHAHIDHCGIVANLVDVEPDIFMTPPTLDLAYFMGRDTIRVCSSQGVATFTPYELRRMRELATDLDYNNTVAAAGYDVTLYDAGHIPGSSSIYLEGETTLFYTGDIKTTDTRLIHGSDPGYPHADILIIESTYYGKTHTDRRELEDEFIASVESTLDMGGTAVVPCFAVGRTQEVLMILVSRGIIPHIDGMGKDVLKIFEKHPSYVRDAHALSSAFDKADIVNSRKRDRVLKEPSVIVTTAGMLNGGPALHYISKLYDDPKSSILLTGYQVEGTNGHRALQYGQIEADGGVLNLKMNVKQYDFSAHSDDGELKNIVSTFCESGTQAVFTVHGERTEEFAAWIRDNHECEAIAPVLGEEFIID